jgi:hypothetical protein
MKFALFGDKEELILLSLSLMNPAAPDGAPPRRIINLHLLSDPQCLGEALRRVNLIKLRFQWVEPFNRKKMFYCRYI